MKNIILILSGVILAAIVFFAVKGVLFYKKIYTPTLIKKPVEKNTYNILLFGFGGGNHEGAFLTDTIMLFHVDLKSKKATLLSIPRDLWVKLPTKSGSGFHIKINAVYQMELGEMGDVSTIYPDLDQSHFGSIKDAEFTKYIMSQIFGEDIDNYFAIDFSGLTKAIDLLGGVDVNVLKSFTDTQYPIDGKEKDLCNSDTETQFNFIKDYINIPATATDDATLQQLFKDHSGLEEFYNNIRKEPEKAFPCRYETLQFEKGLTHMDGATVLKYVRSRHALEDGGDFGRSARQQQLMIAVKDKVLSVGFVPKIIPLLDELGGDVKTDFNLTTIRKFINLASTLKDYQLTTYIISDQNLLKDSRSRDGQFILIPKKGVNQWAGLKYFYKNITRGILPTPASTATPSGTLNK
jgi:LCP family protein required for cell wall assembly